MQFPQQIDDFFGWPEIVTAASPQAQVVCAAVMGSFLGRLLLQLPCPGACPSEVPELGLAIHSRD